MTDDSLPRTALRNGRVLLSTGQRVVADVVLRGDRVDEVVAVPAGRRAAVDIEIDVSGATVAPGFIDSHVHGALGRNMMAAGAEDLALIGRRLLNAGVTAFVAATATVEFESFLSAVSRLAYLTRVGPAEGLPELLGVHAEGPFLSDRYRGVHQAQHLLMPSEAHLDALLEAAHGALRICTLAPELEGGMGAIDRLIRAGVVVSVGHTAADRSDAAAAFAAGATRVTHLFNAMPPLHHRAPGPVQAALADSRVYPEVVADGVHVDLDLLAMLFSNDQWADRLVLVSDGSDVAGLPDGHHRRWEGTEVELVDGRARTPQGAVAGSTSTLLDCVRLLVQAGVPVETALTAASRNPARSLKLGTRGTIEPGAVADLLVFDDDLDLTMTFVRGRADNYGDTTWISH